MQHVETFLFKTINIHHYMDFILRIAIFNFLILETIILNFSMMFEIQINEFTK